jgi:hypothetical protein
LELLAGDAFEAEQQIIQRTIVMIFTQRSRKARPAFIKGTPGDGESCEAFARTARGFFGEVSGDHGDARNVIIFHVWFKERPSRPEGEFPAVIKIIERLFAVVHNGDFIDQMMLRQCGQG